LIPQNSASQSGEGSQRENLLPVPRHASSASAPRRLATWPAQGDAHLQFESPLNIEILEFTRTNLASRLGRVHGPLCRYYTRTRYVE
ncbi:hypothetical protein X777_08850, partial [Ooceraea biroi]